MKTKTSRTPTVTLDLDETISADVQAKLYHLCRKRGLLWPEGIVFLLEEASEPHGRAKAQPRISSHASVRTKKVR